MPLVKQAAPYPVAVCRLLALCSSLSLLLCAAVCVLWARSYGYSEGVTYARVWPEGGGRFGGRSVSAASWPGRVVLTHAATAGADEPWREAAVRVFGTGWSVDSTRHPDGRPKAFVYDAKNQRRSWLDDFYGRQTRMTHGVMDTLIFPYWAAAALTAVAPVAWGIRAVGSRWRRRRRAARGLCPACGYDLRASSGACPECGREGPQAARAALKG